MVDLDELERLEREATPGRWGYRMNPHGGARVQTGSVGIADVLSRGGVPHPVQEHCEANARLIATARNALPDLLDELRTLRARVADADAVRHSLNEMVRVLDGAVSGADADLDAEAIERVLGTVAWNDQLAVVKADTVRYWMAKIEGLRRTIKSQVGELRAARDAQSAAEEEAESLRARVAELEEDNEWLRGVVRTSCVHKPTPGCDCPGCETARERAAQVDLVASYEAELEEDRQGERDRILGARVRELARQHHARTNDERHDLYGFAWMVMQAREEADKEARDAD